MAVSDEQIENAANGGSCANTNALVSIMKAKSEDLTKLLADDDKAGMRTDCCDNVVPRLGLARLKLVRLLESLVLLANRDIDLTLISKSQGRDSNCISGERAI